ncbi:hypothetical protein BC943DRAFT_37954 [Umbelopsis sp. AD052]|nr:hypothetical protein BC943DRAFT_37954 [Umbelopsis sp. AD052]
MTISLILSLWFWMLCFILFLVCEIFYLSLFFQWNLPPSIQPKSPRCCNLLTHELVRLVV